MATKRSTRGLDKDGKRLLKAAKDAGWEVRYGKNHSFVLYPPNGERPIPLTSSTSYRNQRNRIAQLRRNGLDV